MCAQKTQLLNVFISRVHGKDPCSYLLATLLIEMWNSWWLQKEFGHGSALWDANKFRLLEIFFGSYF